MIVLRNLKSIVVAGTLLSLMIGGMVVFFEESLIYFPTKYPIGNWNTSNRKPCGIEDVYFEAADGVKTHGWFLERPKSDRVLVYFHGNAGSIADRYEWGCQLVQSGASVLMVEYRGYGRSEGRPGEAGFYEDAEAVWTWLLEKRGYLAHQIVLYGKSLGGAVAAELALRHPPGALILQSTFTSIPEMAKRVVPFVPKFLIRTRFDTQMKVPNIACPILVIHSEADEIVPFAMGERLANAAPNLKEFMRFSSYGHNDLIWNEAASIIAGIRRLIE